MMGKCHKLQPTSQLLISCDHGDFAITTCMHVCVCMCTNKGVEDEPISDKETIFICCTHHSIRVGLEGREENSKSKPNPVFLIILPLTHYQCKTQRRLV